ncbi:MAG: GNAT family N-acetyltransferase [Dehalococcoidales bacterium]|nr:GNAT family N-acetyltransferase [Dehalococcoidales bacterium]
MLKFEYMKPEQLHHCGMLLIDSFFDYEYNSNYVSDAKKRRNFLQYSLPLELKLNIDSAIILTAEDDSDLAAVAVLFPPGIHRKSDITYIVNGFWKAAVYGGLKDVMAWMSMDSSASKPCHSLKDTWYLDLIAVAPKKQGQGIGTRFLNESIIPEVKNGGGDQLCLFTNSESNLKFYKDNDFRVFDYQEFNYKDRPMGSWSCIRDI